MNAPLRPGTPCYLVLLTERRDLCGRPVIIERGPLELDEPGPWYAYTAAWSRQMFPGVETLTRRGNLLPIVPPEILPSAARKRTPVFET